MTVAAINTEGLKKNFGERAAVKHLTLQVLQGEVFGFLGPNGAGKTTSIKMLLGLVRPTSGSATLLGAPIGDRPTLGRVGFLPEHFRFQEWLTAREVVSVAPDLPLNQLINSYFLHYGYKGFPVAQAGRVLGMVSVFNVKGLPEDQQKTKTVAQVMEPLNDDLLISPQVSLTEALSKMGQTEAGRLVVMQGGKMVGLISKTGLLRYLEMKRILEG